MRIALHHLKRFMGDETTTSRSLNLDCNLLQGSCQHNSSGALFCGYFKLEYGGKPPISSLIRYPIRLKRLENISMNRGSSGCDKAAAEVVA